MALLEVSDQSTMVTIGWSQKANSNIYYTYAYYSIFVKNYLICKIFLISTNWLGTITLNNFMVLISYWIILL